MELGGLDRERGNAIVAAAEEVLSDLNGRYSDQFPVDVFQTGAGTSFNMNINEVLANRALEILGQKRGDYALLSPNDHVNMGNQAMILFQQLLISRSSLRLTGFLMYFSLFRKLLG